jgi:hypothetical protein
MDEKAFYKLENSLLSYNLYFYTIVSTLNVRLD